MCLSKSDPNMKLSSSFIHFDSKNVEQSVISERNFITGLFSILTLPKRNDENQSEDEETEEIPTRNPETKSKRAKSLTELQERLEAISSKKKLSYQEKMSKKKLKNQMKKKNKREERNAAKKIERAQKLTENNGEMSTKIENDIKSKPPTSNVFNGEQNLAFSKIKVGHGTITNDEPKQHKKKQTKDPKKVLENLEKQREKLAELEKEGDIEKVVAIKETKAWNSALAKARGEKIKDDPILLKKTIQKQKQKKKASEKKWQSRLDNVEKAKEERQKKRTENIDKKKKDKQKKKHKKAEKKGRVVLK